MSRRSGKVYLTGFMGAGKTSVGQALARRLGWEFYDTDQLISARAGKTIPEIFDQDGEACFRQLETEALTSVASEHDAVVALGGGAVDERDNWQKVRATGLSVYLRWPLAVLLDRILSDPGRPLATRSHGAAQLTRLFESRQERYQAADLVVDCDRFRSPDAIVDELLKLLEGVA